MSAAQPSIEPSPSGRGPAPAERRALPRPTLREPVRLTVPESVLPRAGLCALLAGIARIDPLRVAFSDAAPKRAWCARPPMTWSYGTAAEIAARLGRALHGWRLPPGSRIGLWFPGSTEGLVAHLAVEAAGHVPCPLPASWTEDQAAAGIQAAGLSAVLTQTRAGSRRPAEALCRIAAGYFGLRYLAAFGPDVPDGVINLDALALDRSGTGPLPETGGGLVSFALGDPARPVHRSGDALLAAIALHLASARIAPSDRILTLLPPSDLRGLVTGLGAALASGASLETMPVFEGAGLAETLARPIPTHLVAPAFLEQALRALPPSETLRATVLAHRAPMRLPHGSDPGPGPMRLDVLAFDEDVVLSARRDAADLARVLAEPGRLAMPPALFGLRREPDGRLAFRGRACAASLVRRGETAPPETDAFRVSRFRADLFAGTVIAVSEA